MENRRSFEKAITSLEAVRRDHSAGKFDHLSTRPAEFTEAQETVLPKYQPIFTADHLPSLTEAEFRSFLPFRNNRHWNGLERQGSRICRDMPLLRKTLAILLDHERPLAERYNITVNRINGMGKAIATAVLLISEPNKYGVWNRKSQEGLQLLGLWPDLPRGTSDGDTYAAINDILLDLALALNVNLWTLDLYWHYLLYSAEHAAADLEDGDFETQPQSKNEALAEELQDIVKTLSQDTATAAGQSQWLWQIADIMRGQTTFERHEYVIPVMSLLFLRYLDERYNQIEREVEAQITQMSVRRRGRADKRVMIQAAGAWYLAEQSRFSYLRGLSQAGAVDQLGTAVAEAVQVIETDNHQLRDVIPTDFAALDGRILAVLIQAIAQLESGADQDALTRIYQLCVAQYASSQSKGDYGTPHFLSQLLATFVAPKAGRIFDPAVGMGGTLTALAEYAAEHGQQANISLAGQDLNARSVRVGRMSLIMYGFEVDIRLEDSLVGPLPQNHGQFDCIATVPSFDLRITTEMRSRLLDNPRYPFGVPRSSSLLWLQLLYTGLTETGRGAMVTTSGAAQTSGAELDIRRQLIQTGAVEAVIHLPPNIMFGTSVSPIVWLINKTRTADDPVLFIDGRRFHQKSKTNNLISAAQIRHLVDLVAMFRGETVSAAKPTLSQIIDGEEMGYEPAADFPDGRYTDVVGICKAATLSEIEEQNWNLIPSRYVGDESVIALEELLGKSAELGDVPFATLGDLATDINNPRDGRAKDGEPFTAEPNTVYIPLMTGKGAHVAEFLPERPHGFIQVVLDPTKVKAGFVAHVLNSQHGVRMRQTGSSGSTLPRLQPRQVERLQVPRLLLAEQEKILETRQRWQKLDDLVDDLRQKLYSDPFSLGAVNEILDLVEGNMTRSSDTDQEATLTPNEISFEQWVESLPYPLATILRTYMADPSPKEKVGHLFNFFEALSAFLTMVLVSGPMGDHAYYEDKVRPRMAKGFTGRNATWYERPSFGNWIHVWGFFAKRIRGTFNQKDEKAKMDARFGQPDASFFAELANDKLRKPISDTADLRNDYKGHGGFMDDATAQAQLRQLEEKLDLVRRLIGSAFQTTTVIRPIPGTMDWRSGLFTCQVEIFHGANNYFTPQTIKSSSPLESDKLYLWTGDHADPIEMPPFLKLTGDSRQIDCYFYNGTVKNEGSPSGKVCKWVCYHRTDTPKLVEDDATPIIKLLRVSS